MNTVTAIILTIVIGSMAAIGISAYLTLRK